MLVTPVDSKSMGNGFQVINLPAARIVAHSGKKFFVCAHKNGVTYDTISQVFLVAIAERSAARLITERCYFLGACYCTRPDTEM